MARAAESDPWLREHPPEVEWLGLNKEGAETPTDHPFVQTASAAFVRAMGREPILSGFPAGCDLPHLTRHGGIPGLVFGPGNCTIAHGSNEWVSLDETLRAAQVVALTAVRWCGGPSREAEAPDPPKSN